jgi:hypothetical protein
MIDANYRDKQPITVTYPDGFKVTINEFLSIKEEAAFIDEVVINSYGENGYNAHTRDIAFNIAFLKYFTDVSFATISFEKNGLVEQIIDNEKMHETYLNLNLFQILENERPVFMNYINNLKNTICNTIKHRNDLLIAEASIAHANEFAINSFGEACYSLIKIFDTINSTLEDNSGKLIEKIMTAIKPENIEKLMSLLPNDAKDLINILQNNPYNK